MTASPGAPPASVPDPHAPSGQGQQSGRLRTLVEGVPNLFWRSDGDGLWTWTSPQWTAHTGLAQAESAGRGWLQAVHPDDRDATVQAWGDAGPRGELEVEFRLRRARDGAYAWYRAAARPMRDGAGRIVEWLGTATVVQEYKDLQAAQDELLAAAERRAQALEAEVMECRRLEADLLHTAFHDGLTGTRNRAYLMDRLRHILDLPRDAEPPCALLYFDLDRFSVVNNSLGHHAGDLLLVEVARRFQLCLRRTDLLARLGGDEFAVLVEDATGLDGLTSLARRLISALREPLQIGAQEVFTSCSIGLVVATDRHRMPEDLVRDADLAMYEAKRHRNGSFAVFNEAMHDRSAGGLALQTDLRHAIAQGGLVLHYQPICETDTGRMVGLEALVRWTDAARGAVPPSLFIPAAEEAGLIGDLGRWVLQDACVQMRAWRSRAPQLGLRLSVNVSGKELMDRRFVKEVRDTLAGAGLDPCALQLEVTEGVFLDQPEVVGEILDALRALGIRIALDDFGTGYSSLGYLEDEAQLRLLRAAGCRLVQGYLFGRPMPAAGFEASLAPLMH